MIIRNCLAAFGKTILAGVLLALPYAPATGQDSSPGASAAPGWGETVVVKPASPVVGKRASPTTSKTAAPGSQSARSGSPKQRAQKAASSNIVSGFAATGDTSRTVVTFELVGPADAAARSLSNPNRVILDLPEIEFRLPPGIGATGHGLVSSFRFGLIEAGKSRIVLDTTSPVRIERAEVVLPQASATFLLEVELVAISAAEQAAAEIADAARALKPSLPDTDAKLPPKTKGLRPVIVVDPGHGGIDPGTSGSRVAEKVLVLDVALALRQALVATRRYEVVMTRVNDVFISLDERVRLARQHHAELFVSLHADSLPGREQAKVVRGATVYTLADVASDENARRLAEKENAVDLLAGLPMTNVGDDQVRTILIDLMRRESLNFSNDFRGLLISQLSPRILLSKDPLRSGPFKVLRQPGSAAVLIELGYMSNAQDEAIMLSADWQIKVAKSIAAAIDQHFSRRASGPR